jgi:ATP sulfurylase
MPAYCGPLCDLFLDQQECERLRAQSLRLTSISLSPVELCELEPLPVGGFSPLKEQMPDFNPVI